MTELILIILIILYIVGTKIYDYILSTHQYEKISIRESLNLTGNPIIMLENNGNMFNFVLDTGANKSVIDTTVLERCTYEKVPNVYDNNMGINGKSALMPNVVIKLKGRKTEYSEEFNVSDLNGVIAFIKSSTGVTIHGIIGTPFLAKYKYVIDFDDLVIYSRKR